MPLPQKYRKPVDDFFAGKITGKELREMIERIDNVQVSFEWGLSCHCEPPKAEKQSLPPKYGDL